MYTLNGFSNIPLLADNTPGIVPPIGEITPQALTYSREVGQYSKTVYPDIKLFSFLSADDSGLIKVPDVIVTQVLEFSQWLYNRTAGSTGSMARDQILEDLLNTYQSQANSFDCGQIKSSLDGRYSLPEWLSWRNNSYEAGNNFIKIFFSDESFQSQYDRYTNVPVYPFLPVDDFFLGHDQVVARLTGRPFAQQALDIEAAKAGHPETVLWGDTFDYVSPLTGEKFPAPFNCLIHGLAGNTIDNIKDAIVADILSKTTHSRDEWVAILPDLFKRTEVVVIPLWDQFAMPDSAQRTGVHSPFALHSKQISVAKQLSPGYPAYHVEQNLEAFGFYYKSLVCVAVGGIESRDEKFRLSQYFKDYICVSPQSGDFSRMTKRTSDWVLLMAELVLAAEVMTEFSTVPQGMTRLERNDVMYAVKSYEKVQYLVATKANFF